LAGQRSAWHDDVLDWLGQLARHDRVDTGGNVTLRVQGQLHHIGVGRANSGTRIVLLVADLDVRIIDAATGELLRHLSIDPNRRYRGSGDPIGGPRRPYGARKRNDANPETQVRPFPMA
jgi:hypothetical protein